MTRRLSFRDYAAAVMVCLLGWPPLATGQGVPAPDSPTNAPAAVQVFRNCGLPAQALEQLRDGLRKMDAAGFDYPWDGLEEEIRKMPDGKLPLIGYGSLLNRDSAARTITNPPASGYPPVVALGALRVFNYEIPESGLNVYRGKHRPEERAALNLIYTRSPDNALNGRLLKLSPADVPALRRREFGYDLRPVVYTPWGDWSKQPLVSYVLVARNREREGHRLVNDELLPNPAYARVCRWGARSVSSDFLKFYLETTYLPDRKTTLEIWERSHPELAEDPSK